MGRSLKFEGITVDRSKSKVCNKSLGKSVFFREIYGWPVEYTKHEPFNGQQEAKTFRGSCYGCGKRGDNWSYFSDCKSNRKDYREYGAQALEAINAVSTLTQAADLMNELKAQYREEWEELLWLYQESEITNEESEDKKEIELALQDENGGSKNDITHNRGDGNFAAQFDVFFRGYLGTPNEIAIYNEISSLETCWQGD